MKKMLFCSMAVVLCMGNALGAECTVIRDFSVTNNNWLTSSNEYLFPTERDYLDSANEANVWQCGMGNCADETYKCLDAGHTFKSNTSTVRKCYKCHAPWLWDRYWEEVTNTAGLTECNNMKRENGIIQDAEANEYLYPTSADYNSVKSRRTGQVYECDGSACQYGTTKTLNSGHYFGSQKITSTRTYKCVSGDEWIDITDDINSAGKAAEQEKTAPKSNVKPDKKPDAKPDKKPDAKPNAKPKPDGDKTPKAESCLYTFSATVVCGGRKVEMSNSLRLQADELKGDTCEDFNKKYSADVNMVQAMVNEYNLCDGYLKTIDFTAANAAREKLEAFFSKIDGDRSVWKNADGSFNGARLASDLTAGVVLGTVGGVVSGVLIKKSQVEKGFDALNCTVSGQKVADWGDDFSVRFRM